MVSKTLTYTDYEGVERTETFHFHLTQAEVLEMEYSTDGGLQKHIQKIIDTKNPKELMTLFKDIVIKSYGVKSEDGRRFIKNDKVRAEFTETEAYSLIFMELATDADAATKFIEGILPKMDETKDKPAIAKVL